MPYEVIRGTETLPIPTMPQDYPAQDYPAEAPAVPEEIPEEPRDKIDYLRHGIRTVSRGVEAVMGLPGDIAYLGSSLMNMGIHALTGGEYVSPLLKGIEAVTPTSERIRDWITRPIAETLAGKGYLDPQSKGAEIADDIAGDLAVFLLPIKGRIPFKKALMTAGLGHMAKFAGQTFQLPEPISEGLKLGTMLAVNFAGPKKFQELTGELYNEVRTALPEGAQVGSKTFQPVLEKLGELFNKGALPSDWKKKIAYYGNQIANKKIPVQDVWDLSMDINNLFYGVKKPTAFKRAFSGIKEGLGKTLKEYGHVNPRFYNSLTEANDLYGSLRKSSFLTSLLEKTVTPEKLGLSTIGTLFGWYSPITLAKTAGTALVGKKMLKTYDILSKSPTARKYFQKSVGEALKYNIRGATHFAKKLDDEFNKHQEMVEKPSYGKYEVVRS